MNPLPRRFARAILPAIAIALCASPLRAQHAAPAPGAPAKPAAAAAGAEAWKGTVALPGGQSVDFTVALTRGPKDGEGASGTISIPMQGFTDSPLADVSFDGARTRFTLVVGAMSKETWPSWEIEFAADGQSGKGDLLQAGMRFPTTMTRLKEGETIGPNRPQTPKAPFPYASREVTYTNSADGTLLAGALTTPQGAGPFPCVLLITGSGAQDRDETLLGHKPFLVIADALTRLGVAVLRVDDRGRGGSTSPKNGDETTDDFVGDVLAGVAFLKTQKDIDPKRIGLVGHSEGGLIAPMVAAQSKDVAYIVMLAGPGISGRDVLVGQVPAGLAAAGLAPALVDAARVQTAVLIDAVKANDDAAAKAALGKLVRAEMGLAEDAELSARGQQMVAAGWQMFDSKWMRRFFEIDPAVSLRQTKCPVLALNGELDLQVLPSQNIPAIEAALREGGNADFQTHVFPSHNHLFQHCKTGAESEYAEIEESFSPEALQLMSDWIRKRAGVRN